MNSEMQSNAELWVEHRAKTLRARLEKILPMRVQLMNLDLWRPKDESRLENVATEASDYLDWLRPNSERSHAVHSDLCLEGPWLSIPSSPGCLKLEAYVWRVDNHIELLERLLRTRLAFYRMSNNPPAQPISEMSIKLVAWRAYQNPEKFIYELCENRPEYISYLTTMEADLEEHCSRELDFGGPAMFKRYRLANLTLGVTATSHLRLTRLSFDMTLAELLQATEVTSELPARPVVQKLSIGADEEIWRTTMSANHQALDNYLAQFNRAWRKLTTTEINEILELMVE
jgi:hypothetical protein